VFKTPPDEIIISWFLAVPSKLIIPPELARILNFCTSNFNLISAPSFEFNENEICFIAFSLEI
jgi:hypothetical protein